MRSTITALVALTFTACGGGGDRDAPPPTPPPPVRDDTAAVQAAVDKGGAVMFAAKIYHLSRTIVITQSGTSIIGAGSDTVFDYQPSQQLTHCLNDRVFTTPCSFDDAPPRQIAAPIAVGDTSFTATIVTDVA